MVNISIPKQAGESQLLSSANQRNTPLIVDNALILCMAIQNELNSLIAESDPTYNLGRGHCIKSDYEMISNVDDKKSILDEISSAKMKGLGELLISSFKKANPNEVKSPIIAEYYSEDLIKKTNEILDPNNRESKIVMLLLNALTTIKLTRKKQN